MFGVGSFAKGFITSYIEMMKLQMTRELIAARIRHYDNLTGGNHTGVNNPLYQQAVERAYNGYGAGSVGGGGNAGYPANSGYNNEGARAVAKVLTDRGVKPDVASGVVAGLMGESGTGLSAAAFNSKDPGGSGGIGQWNGNRLTGDYGLLQFARNNGVDVNPNNARDSAKVPLDIQVKFLASELDTSKSNVLHTLQGASTGQQGLDTWVRHFEVPADPNAAIAQRSQYIQPVSEILKGYSKADAETQPSGAGTYYIGDSIAEGLKGKEGRGNTLVGRNPQAVLDEINSDRVNPADLSGKQIVLSTGISNDPKSVGLVQDQIDALKKKGVDPSNIIVTGVGSRQDIAAASPALQKIVKDNGIKYGGDFKAGADQVHPENYDTYRASFTPQSNTAIASSPAAPAQTAPAQTAPAAASPGESMADAENEDKNLLASLGGESGGDESGFINSPPPPTPQLILTPDWNPPTDVVEVAKGGAIPPRAMTKFAMGGPSGVTYSGTSNNPGQAQGMMTQPWDYMGYAASNPNAPFKGGATPLTYDQYKQDFAALNSDQQTYSNNMRNWTDAANAQLGGGDIPAAQQLQSQIKWAQQPAWTTPAAAAPAAGAAAPASTPAPSPVAPVSSDIIQTSADNPQIADPVALAKVDPSTEEGTGAIKLPNYLGANSYDPNKDSATGASFTNTSNKGGTNYSVGTDDLLKKNAKGDISGTETILSAKGGAIPVTPRVRYDDGGGVGPSVLGAPPGMSGGAGQPTPPYYFNNATYAGAGAPVGKGVTANSVGTYVAGAIPTLPMMQGGTVKRYADGGGVEDPDEPPPPPQPVSAPASDAPVDYSATNQLIENARKAQPQAPAPAPAQPQMPAPSPVTGPSMHGQNLVSNENYVPAQASDMQGGGQQRVPDHPSIVGPNGNPPQDFIQALVGGFHAIADHTGLTGGAIQQRTPQHVDNARKLYTNDPSGAFYMSPQQLELTKNIQDPLHQLTPGMRTIAGLQGGYLAALRNGDTKSANEFAAAFMQASNNVSMGLAKQARISLFNNNIPDAVEKFNMASDATPDGYLHHMTLNPDGTITMRGQKVDGEALWEKTGMAQSVLELATKWGGMGVLQWDSMEASAGQHDPTFKAQALERMKNQAARGKQELQDQSEARVASSGVYAPLRPVTQGGNSAGPTITPAATTPPEPSPVTRPVQPAASPVGAISTAHPEPAPIGPAAGSSLTGMPTGPAATSAAGMDTVEGVNARENDVARSDNQIIEARYTNPANGNIYYGTDANGQRQQWARPSPPDTTGLSANEQKQALDYYSRTLKQYDDMKAENQKNIDRDIADKSKMRQMEFEAIRQKINQKAFAERQGRVQGMKHRSTPMPLRRNAP